MDEKAAAEKVRAAITNSRYQWRTAQGIAADVGISAEAVSRIISNGNDFLQAYRPNARGETLYTTREKYLSDSTLAQRILDAMTNKVGI
jgi:hypothetical protein